MKKTMKKRVLLFLGMGSCVSTPGDQRSVNPENSSLEAVKWSSVPAKAAETTKESAVTLQALVFEAPGSLFLSLKNTHESMFLSSIFFFPFDL